MLCQNRLGSISPNLISRRILTLTLILTLIDFGWGSAVDPTGERLGEMRLGEMLQHRQNMPKLTRTRSVVCVPNVHGNSYTCTCSKLRLQATTFCSRQPRYTLHREFDKLWLAAIDCTNSWPFLPSCSRSSRFTDCQSRTD